MGDIFNEDFEDLGREKDLDDIEILLKSKMIISL